MPDEIKKIYINDLNTLDKIIRSELTSINNNKDNFIDNVLSK
jgi:hypothetical protein